jgi:nucleoside-diphosphate kinase
MIRSIFLGALLVLSYNALQAENPALVPAAKNASTTKEREAEDRTLVIIKPNAVKERHVGEIITDYEKAGFKIAGLKVVRLSKAQAEQFYAVHKDRPFYQELVEFIGSGPVVVMAMEGENAVLKSRELIGATDPQKAAPNTIRAKFAKSIKENAIHGSDSPDNAKQEIAFFFTAEELQ